MKQYVLTLIVAILSVACHDNKKIGYSNEEQLLKVSPCIEDAFYYFLKHENETPDTDFVYSIDFMKGFPGLSDQDTMIGFCRMNENMPLDGLRGLLTIGEYKLLVLDEQKIGESFYNVDSLKEIDINKACMSNDTMSVCCTFVISDSVLRFLCIQPDDYEPIRISRISVNEN